MAIPPSSDRANEPPRSRADLSRTDSLSGDTLAASPSVNPPPIADQIQASTPSRAGFVPIAPKSQPQEESRDRLNLPSEPGARVVVLSDDLGSIEPSAPNTPRLPKPPRPPKPPETPQSSTANPFNADVFEFGETAVPDSRPFAASEPSRLADPVVNPVVIVNSGASPRDDLAVNDSAIAVNGWTWRNAGRAERWTRQKSPGSGHLRRRELIASIVMFSLISIGVHGLMQRGNDLLLTIGQRPIQALYLNHNIALAIALALIAVSAPYVLDLLLRQRYNAQPLTPRRLATHSPEAAEILTRFAKHKHRAKPMLYTVKTPAALVWVYGYGQRSLRLVISSGAIETLTADEIAIEVAAGIAAGVQGDVLFATVSVALLQVPYLLYDGFTAIGDRCQAWTQGDRPAKLSFDRATLRILGAEIGLWLTATIATLAYGVYRLLRLPLLAWSRLRQTYADRFAANLTGNPNARARSLVKQALTQRRDFDRDHAFSMLCERFELFSSVNPRHGLWCGADPLHPPIARLGWDAITPYSTWLAIGEAHPALGQRLAFLTRLAQQFDLEPEFPSDVFRHDPNASRRPRTPKRNVPITPASLLESADLMSNVTPLIGIVAAIGLVGLAAGFGTVGRLFDWRSLSWLQADWPWLALGLGLEGFAIGTVLRINAFFPDFKPYALNADPDLDRWITDPDSLPIDSRTLRLSGRLVGRRGVGNWFGQDLWLDDGSTLWPLHYLDRTGWLGWLLPTHDRANRHIGNRVTITGWFRRGVTPWIDVDRLEPIPDKAPSHSTPNGSDSRLSSQTHDPKSTTAPQNGHPLWSTAIASLCAVWGAVLLARGGF